VLVLCEDSKSCLNYLTDAARHFRSYAEVEIAHCGRTDPKGIVAEASARRRSFDKVYCAIDRDEHDSFDEAFALAERAGVEVIVSYPSYEFWLLLHFRLTRAPHKAVGNLSAGERMVKALRAEPGMAQYQKGGAESHFGALIDRLPVARSRAKTVLDQAMQDEEMNPSTHLHLLIEVLEKLGTLLAAD
jgi:RloB-like protein